MSYSYKISKICLWGLIVRLIALSLTLMFSDNLTTGYLRSNYDSDDLRYMDGAIIYSETASSIIDVPAFISAFRTFNDNVGLSEDIALWYWLMCIMMYIFKYPIIVKIINILFGVICISLIYKICKFVFPHKEKIGILASSLYAFFPYPVFFCCFVYKDQFLTLILLSIIYIVYKNSTIINIKSIIQLTILLIAFNLIRSGLLPIILICIGYIEFKKNPKKYGLSKPINTFILVSITAIFVYYLYMHFSDIISHKFKSYVENRIQVGSGGDTISYFIINSPLDLWKAPLAYAFTIIQPLYTGSKILNWSSIVGILNACTIPIMIVSVYYWFIKKSNNVFWMSIMILFMVMLIVSMGISRHFYYLLPFVFIFYSDAIVSESPSVKSLNKVGIGLAVFYTFAFILPIACLFGL